MAKKTSEPNLQNVQSIIKNPAACAEAFLNTYDAVAIANDFLEQAKTDIRKAVLTDSKLNDKLVFDNRIIKVEPRVSAGFAQPETESVKNLLSSADFKEVTTVTVNAQALNELALRYEKRGNVAKALQIRELLIPTETVTYSVAVRKVGATVGESTSNAAASAKAGTFTVSA